MIMDRIIKSHLSIINHLVKFRIINEIMSHHSDGIYYEIGHSNGLYPSIAKYHQWYGYTCDSVMLDHHQCDNLIYLREISSVPLDILIRNSFVDLVIIHPHPCTIKILNGMNDLISNRKCQHLIFHINNQTSVDQWVQQINQIKSHGYTVYNISDDICVSNILQLDILTDYQIITEESLVVFCTLQFHDIC